MYSKEAIEQYHAALRRGQKYTAACAARGEDPYPRVLQDIFPEVSSADRAEIGTLEIPMDSIVGTLADGRKTAFAGNFMPLLADNTEFATKWINLCDAHLGESGITDPIRCYEYYGQFYVQEGHKRVSVLRSYDALTIRAHVTRILPQASEEPAYQAYQEFLRFYRRSKIYVLHYDKPGSWKRLEDGLGLETDHEWTEDERKRFLALYWSLREICRSMNIDQMRNLTVGDVLLTCLDVYPFDQLAALDRTELQRRVGALMPEFRFAAEDKPVEVSTEPEIPGKSIVGRLLDSISKPVLNIAFIHVNDPAVSFWTRGHEEGRAYMEKALGDQVRVRTYIVGEEDADALMERAIVRDGAALVFATAPTLLGPARQAAALHPNVKVLLCALSVPAVGVRTYYSRIHEAKFISGAIAGALCGNDPVGYIARYPILGVPAAVNSFALGLRMTNPAARVLLEWSCLGGDPAQRLWAAGARIVSGHPVAASIPGNTGPGWSTSLLSEDGSYLPLARDVWNWGKTYEQMVRGILAGAWEREAPQGTAVSYWWGLSSGVIDVAMSDAVPEGVRHLAEILKRGLADGSIHPFDGQVLDQQGRVRSERDSSFSVEEMMQMNWLCDSVIGHIPRLDELMPAARETTRLLALTEDKPEPAPAAAPVPAPAE
ncbi:MAG: hypothetical protein IJK28_00240 [Clostridia bacterium]|nr:hypothetical protein [Clostridia bacterium]